MTHSPIPATDAELWERLRAYPLDQPGIAFPFSARLARENCWSRSYTSRVLEEYRRFLFLAMAAGHPVTPSVDVDQAWHLHLTFTRSYWEDLCGQVLRAPLHHQPTKGGEEEGEKFHDWYENTLASYERLFGTPPPSDIWPPADVRLGNASRIRQVSERTHWVIRKPRPGMFWRGGALGAAMLLLAGCAVAGFDGIAAGIIVGGVFVLMLFLSRVGEWGSRKGKGSQGGGGGTGDGGSWGGYGDGSHHESGSGGHGGSSHGHSGGHDSGGSHGADSTGGDSGCGSSGCGSGCGGCGGS